MKDLFSEQSRQYALYRPSYPDALFAFILSHVKDRKTAWDCGTGNGQVAVKLSDYFETVYATDLSRNQLANATKRKNIIYQAMQAEEASFPGIQFDLITIAQAIHWFQFETFYQRVREHLKPGGLIAVIGYHVITISPACDKVINRLYSDELGNYWDPERKFIDEHYRSVPFPFEEIPSPAFTHNAVWTFDQLIGYLNTWSAVKHYITKDRQNPVDSISSELREAWGQGSKEVQFPVFVRLGKSHSNSE